MKIVLHAVPAKMNVRLKQYPKVISIRSTLKFVQIAALALMFARLKQFILNNTIPSV
jgi:hypothetical protein